jgi:hypothetical protein
MSTRFSGVELDLLRDQQEIEIETAASEEGPTHRTVIWVVVDEKDRVLIRSYLGPRARWYREITASPACRVHVGDRPIEARAVPATDEERLAACSDGLRRKYADDAATPSMVRNHLETTLELVPR